jgi:hypothetical protein
MRFFYWLAFYVNRAKFEWARGARDGFSSTPKSEEERIVDLLRNQKYVEAIRLHCELFNTSLRDSKVAIDALLIKYNLKGYGQ